MRLSAQIISIVFHPLIVLTYMLIMLLLVNPYLFGVNNLSDKESLKFIITVFFTSFLIPAFAIFMMWRLKLISSLEMRDKQDRIGPFIVTGVFYLWVLRSVMADSNIPTAFLIAALGTTIGLFASFIINIFFKISIHAVSMGGLVGMVLIVMWLYSYGSFTLNLPFIGTSEISINLLLILSIVIAGLVGSSRLFLKAHTPLELYAGFAMGLLCQFISLKILI
jgi:membrane-associated phospholipid phosphatase